MQIPHLSEEATQYNDILCVQIAPDAPDRLAAAAEGHIPKRMTSEGIVSAVACVALGMEPEHIGKKIHYSRQTVGERLAVAADAWGVPPSKPAIVRAAFRHGALDVASNDEPGAKNWPVKMPLAERASQVFDGISLGLSDEEIARALRISEGTVRHHRSQVRERWKVPKLTIGVTVGHHVGFFVRGVLSDERVTLPLGPSSADSE